MPDFSVIVPSYNRAAHLRRNLLSLAHQTYDHQRVEVVVIDDGSTDDTRRVVDDARQAYDLTIRYVYLHRPFYCNPALAWNVGIRRSTAETIVFQGADVIAAPNALDLFASYVADADAYAYVFANCYRIHSPMTEALLDHIPWTKDFARIEELFVSPFHHSAYWHVPMLAAIHKVRLVEIGGFDESYTDPWPEDEDCWVRLQARGVYAINCPDLWACHQWHPQQDPICYRGCSCPLWQKSGTWPHKDAKYDGLAEDIIRNKLGWGELPEGSYED
jgi:glycosyltransferase involved in cell wall biosynthesis